MVRGIIVSSLWKRVLGVAPATSQNCRPKVKRRSGHPRTKHEGWCGLLVDLGKNGSESLDVRLAWLPGRELDVVIRASPCLCLLQGTEQGGGSDANGQHGLTDRDSPATLNACLHQLQLPKLHLPHHRLRVSPPAARVVPCPGGSAEPSAWVVYLDSEFCLLCVPLPTLSRRV